ncbi:hypothetical protein BJV78DRAFT_706594 [Lactifluus subvellereus]|nr:hypothetical protein BJV78DRAFT_706594 [Lactifluus subvellereus]
MSVNISERSRSRGRGLQSSGRGGTGNIRSPSQDPVVGPGPEDHSDTRGREPFPVRHPDELTSTGRGGAGNIRSPNLTPEVPYLESAVHPHGADHPHATHTHEHESSGRGGAGNISGDHSRGPAESRNKDHGFSGLLHRVAHPGTHVGEPVKVKENF